jgi:hypothetical protein
MIAANHHRPRKHAGHGELRATIFAEDILAHGNHLLRVMTNHRCSGALPIQSNRPAFRILLSISFLFVGALAAGQTSPPAPAKSVQSSTTPMANTLSPEASKYVGAETCKTCHEEIYPRPWGPVAYPTFLNLPCPRSAMAKSGITGEVRWQVYR